MFKIGRIPFTVRFISNGNGIWFPYTFCLNWNYLIFLFSGIYFYCTSQQHLTFKHWLCIVYFERNVIQFRREDDGLKEEGFINFKKVFVFPNSMDFNTCWILLLVYIDGEVDKESEKRNARASLQYNCNSDSWPVDNTYWKHFDFLVVRFLLDKEMATSFLSICCKPVSISTNA